MGTIFSAIKKILTPSAGGSSERREEEFNRYLLFSLLIHFVLIVFLSISYTRSMKPLTPSGPYEVSLIQMEPPEPTPPKVRETEQDKPKPKPQPPKEKPKEVAPEEKKQEEVVKINPEINKKKQPVEKKPEPPPEPEPEEPQRPAPDSLLAEKDDTKPSQTVGGFQVDNPNFNFNYYLAILRDKIQRNWRPPSGLPAREEGFSAVVRFTIGRDGTISRADVEESSGLAFFDQSALRAVVNSNPAPPLPRAYAEDRLGVHVSFVFNEEGR